MIDLARHFNPEYIDDVVAVLREEAGLVKRLAMPEECGYATFIPRPDRLHSTSPLRMS